MDGRPRSEDAKWSVTKRSTRTFGNFPKITLVDFNDLDRSLVRIFTFYNGAEFYYHRKLTCGLGVKVYFADPDASGQRGTNQNTNGLIRQYFPKTLDYGLISHWDVKTAQRLINERPRLRLDFQTPAAVLGKHPKIAFQI